jgi:hypothetical protein
MDLKSKKQVITKPSIDNLDVGNSYNLTAVEFPNGAYIMSNGTYSRFEI